jgi:hypothetical protein
MDHKTLIFAGNRETETPVMKPKNIEILGNTSQAGLKDQAHRAWINPKGRMTERDRQMEDWRRRDRGDRDCKPFFHLGLPCTSMVEVQIRQASHGRAKTKKTRRAETRRAEGRL